MLPLPSSQVCVRSTDSVPCRSWRVSTAVPDGQNGADAVKCPSWCNPVGAAGSTTCLPTKVRENSLGAASAPPASETNPPASTMPTTRTAVRTLRLPSSVRPKGDCGDPTPHRGRCLGSRHHASTLGCPCAVNGPPGGAGRRICSTRRSTRTTFARPFQSASDTCSRLRVDIWLDIGRLNPDRSQTRKWKGPRVCGAFSMPGTGLEPVRPRGDTWF
jgi:hypothetical protein